MANFSTWLLAIFMIMFWLFRAIVALCSQFSIDLLGIVAYDFRIEVIIAFLTLPCIVLIMKRKLVGSLIYLGIYGVYFGRHLLINIIPLILGFSVVTINSSLNLISDIIAISLAIFTVVDMLIDRGRKSNPIDRKTDWYFKNEKYDKELKNKDSREDKNEYKYY